jgi:hypothetical protein
VVALVVGLGATKAADKSAAAAREGAAAATTGADAAQKSAAAAQAGAEAAQDGAVAAQDSAAAAQDSADAAQQAADTAESTRVDLESRSRREEVMRNVRWASELAISEDKATRELGIEQLKVLRDSPLSDSDVKRLIFAALKVVVMERIEKPAGADVGVKVQITADGVVAEPSSALPSNRDPTTDAGGDRKAEGGDDGK